MRRLPWFDIGLFVWTCSCALPIEEHGGLSPNPEPSDLTFVTAGAAINSTGLLLHAPTWVRVGADAVAVLVLRFPKWGGRYEGVAITLPAGAFIPEWLHMLIHGIRHPSHPDCWVIRGPDTVVTQPVMITPQRGRMWGNECLTR